MTGPVPGPGIVVIPVGLAMLALEFDWANRLLEKVLVRAAAAREGAGKTSRAQRIAAAAVAVLVIGGVVVAAVLWDLPLVPF